MNFTLLLTALLASMFTVSEPLPLGPGNPREELTTRCLAELLSRAFSKANASPLDPGCRDMLNAGLKHDAAKKNEEEVEDLQGIHRQTDEETRRHEEDGGHAGDGDPDVTKATENLLLDEEKRHHGLENLQTYAGDEEVASKPRSNHLLDTTGQEESEEEAHYLQRRYEEREKRMWKPTHRYHHNKHWSGEDSLQDREPEEADSASKEKQTWTPAHHSKHRRGEDSAEDDESEESDEVKFKQKGIWRPTHRTHHTTRNSNEDLDESEQLRFDNSEEDKSKERKRVWKPKHTLHHKMHRWSRESDQDRVWSPTSKLQYMKHRKNGVPSEEEEPEEMEIRAGKPWYSYQQKKHPGEESEEEDEDKKKRSWSHSYREKDQRRRRGDSSEVEESDEEKPERRLDGILELPYRRRDAEDHEGGNQPDEAEEERDEKLKSLRFLTQDSKEAGIPMEAELQEKGWPAVEKHYHPSWWKRAGKAKQQLEWWGQQAYPTHTMQELAKILQHKPDREYPRQGEDEKRRVRQRPLTPEEETELENLAAMDMELQKIAEKIQDQQE